MFQATEAPFSPEAVIDLVQRADNGAIVAFVGTLRPASPDGSRVLYAECDSDREPAEQHLRDVGDEVRARWGLGEVAIWHRTGRIEVGETISVVAVGAPHRQAAFEACQYAIDRVKQGIPLREVLGQP